MFSIRQSSIFRVKMTAISNSTNRANTKTARLGRSGSVVLQNLIAALQNLIAACQSLIGLIVAVSSSRWHIAYCCYQVQLNRNIRLRRNAEKLRSRARDLSWRTRPPDLLGAGGNAPVPLGSSAPLRCRAAEMAGSVPTHFSRVSRSRFLLPKIR